MNLKNQLRLYIKERDTTVARLSRQSKVAEQTIRDWISGTIPKDIRKVKKVCESLEVSLDNLCFGKGIEKKDTIEEYREEINAGVFEVVLRRVKK